ncbi:MAG: tetratricopeptide repeat protein [Smithella sp.]
MNPLKQKSSAAVLENQITGKTRLWPWIVTLALLIALPYIQMESHEFINWDDHIYIYDNPIVSAGLSWLGVGWAFITGTASNWHPLTWISHMLDSSLFGPTPMAVHLVNMLWYTGSVLLAFFLFLRLDASPVAAFFMAAFFGLHPLHVESVAWASERKDLLCAFFFLAATISYLDYVRKSKRSLYFLTTFLFVLSLLSKPMAVTWPCVALLFDYWPLRRLNNEPKRVIHEKIPWFALSIISSIITLIVQNKSEAIKSLTDFPFINRLANSGISYLEYIRQSLWPFGLTVFYPYPWSIDTLGVLVSCCILGLITLVVFRQRRKHPYLLWGWLFYLGVLFPVIGLIQVGAQAHADRYTLLPQLGLILATGLFLDKALTNKKIRRTTAVTMTVILAILMIMTFRQVSYWRDSKTLFYQNLDVAGENELAHFNLGLAFFQNNQLELAVTHFLAAAKINPREVTTYNDLGIVYARLNKTSLAEDCFKQAIRLDPKVAQPHFHLAILKIKQGHLSEAMEHLNEAVRLAPDWIEARKLRDTMRESSSDPFFKAG